MSVFLCQLIQIQFWGGEAWSRRHSSWLPNYIYQVTRYLGIYDLAVGRGHEQMGKIEGKPRGVKEKERVGGKKKVIDTQELSIILWLSISALGATIFDAAVFV